MNNKVEITSIDGRIWNSGSVAARILYCLARQGTVTLDLLKEGPDVRTTEIDSIIDTLLELGYSRHQIQIHTGNVVEDYEKASIIKHPEWMFELEEIKKLSSQISTSKDIKKHFGCLVGRSNTIRLIAAGYLYQYHKDKTFLTYHYQGQNDYHREHVGLQDIMYFFSVTSREFKSALNLLQDCPILLDKVQDYPILHPHNLLGPCTWYKDFFVDIVCETFCSGNTFFITEKFWRAVVTKTPFIVYGPQFFLKRLRKLGFKTFDRWWDEGYDEDPYLYSHNEIQKSIDSVAVMSLSDINSMYKDMSSVLEHNYHRMLELTYQDLGSVK
jgi:hypothetical protein